MYEFTAALLTVVYINGSSGVNLSCRCACLPICWSLRFEPKTSLFILLGKIKSGLKQIFITDQIKFKCVNVGKNATCDLL